MLVEGCNSGSSTFASLEQARSKLLLAVIPREANAAHEMRARLNLWDARDFVALLERAEAQTSASTSRRTSGYGNAAATRVARARCIARCGAFRKAVQSQTTEVANMPPGDQRTWAAQLLPPDNGPARAPGPRPEAAAHHDDVEPASSPLEGVRFAALSGPGLSGMRPEHIRDMLNCGRRRVSNRLLRALQVTEALAAGGDLPDAWRWMLDSRLAYIKKKRSATPRPIRVGEVWRRLVAKWLLHKHVPTVRKCMLEHHQYGVSVPGGRDAVVHARRTFRETVQADPALGVWAEVDIDYVNAFPRLLWDYIGDAVSEHVPGLAAWTDWCHDAPTNVTLPCGDAHATDRGSEQGDPHGSLHCGAALAVVRHRATAARTARQPQDSPGAFDFWYADDGSALMPPTLVDLYLETLDAEAARAGCTRGSGADVKSSVTLIGHPDAIADYEAEWVTDRIRDTCKLREPNAPTEVLGAILGSNDESAEQFDAQLRKLRLLHDALEPLADPAIELTLGRACADLCKTVHLLRIHGDILHERGVHEHDDIQRDYVARVLGGDLQPEASRMAEMGVRDGGLGYRRADDHAQPAFVASRTETRPYVDHIFRGMADAGIPVDQCMVRYDAQVAAATDDICARLGGDAALAVREACRACADAAGGAFRTTWPAADQRPSSVTTPRPPLASSMSSGPTTTSTPPRPPAGACSAPWPGSSTTCALAASRLSSPATRDGTTCGASPTCATRPPRTSGYGRSTRARLGRSSLRPTSLPCGCALEQASVTRPSPAGPAASGTSRPPAPTPCAARLAHAPSATTRSATSCTPRPNRPTPTPRPKSWASSRQRRANARLTYSLLLSQRGS